VRDSASIPTVSRSDITTAAASAPTRPAAII
jgi:hypothetical protein